MGFMDKAKEAADDLRSNLAGGDARASEQQYRDLGMIAYLTATGRPIDEADRQRLINQLWETEQGGRLPAFRLVTPHPPPPPPVATPPVATPPAATPPVATPPDTTPDATPPVAEERPPSAQES